MNSVLLGENPKTWSQYLNLVAHLPFSTNAKIRSYPSKFVGVYSQIHLPHGSRVPYLFHDFFRLNHEVLTGFCAEPSIVSVPKQKLSSYWDDTRKRWRWRDINEKWEQYVSKPLAENSN